MAGARIEGRPGSQRGEMPVAGPRILRLPGSGFNT